VFDLMEKKREENKLQKSTKELGQFINKGPSESRTTSTKHKKKSTHQTLAFI
jgi:hypothetical protein